jgi:nucleoid-associated protein YgaU
MRTSGLARGPSCVCRAVVLCGILSVSFCAFHARGQGVAEAARQEKARKAAQQKSPLHVYTEEDLKRKTILTPEDQAHVEARKRHQEAVPPEQNAQQQPDGANPQFESLGEIARRYRQQKAAREAELAAKKRFTPFPYQVPESLLAVPKAGVAPRLAPGLPSGVDNRSAASGYHFVPHFYPPVTGPRSRISPFQPRPLARSSSVPLAGLAGRPAFPLRPSNTVRAETKAVPPKLVSAGTRWIAVQPGQSWWKLAELYLGDGARWPELRKLNAVSGPPDLLLSGSSVVVPAAASNAKVSAQFIAVSQGDTLWSLAKQHFGRGAAWTCLASSNPQIGDYTHLAIGTLLAIPEGNVRNSCQSQVSSQLRQ